MAVTSFRRCSTLAESVFPTSMFPEEMGAVGIGMLLGTKAFGQGK
jgi:hypothetical protein